MKAEMNYLGIGKYRIYHNGKEWIAEEKVHENPACGEPHWKRIGGGKDTPGAVKALFNHLGPDAEYIKKDLIKSIESA